MTNPVCFKTGSALSLGVEEEYSLCHPGTGDLVDAVEGVVARAGPELRQLLSYELLHTVLEVSIPVASSAAEALTSIRRRRDEVSRVAGEIGVAIGICGSHPFARPGEQDFVAAPDYQWVGAQLGYLARRNISFGLHVHVGVPDGEAAVYVCNRMRPWIAPLLALSVNSPFFESTDTGMASIRTFLFGSFPRTGIYPGFRDYDDFSRFVVGLMESRAIFKSRQIWWNLRPHPTYGTVEVRVMDMPERLEQTGAFIALIQALVGRYLDDFQRGVPDPPLSRGFLDDALWKAARFGLDCLLVDPETGDLLAMPALVGRMLDTAGPVLDRLGTAHMVEPLTRIGAEGTGAEHQRRRLKELKGDFRAFFLEKLHTAGG